MKRISMRSVTLLLLLQLTGCSAFSRSFEITKTGHEIISEKLFIYFYSTENLTELSKEHMVQFRCGERGRKENIHGEIFLAPEFFEYRNQDAKALIQKDGRTIAAAAPYILGYKYIGIPYLDAASLKVYSPLECYVIGVTKSLAPFPKSSLITIDLDKPE